MPRLVNSSEGEISIFSRFSIFHTVVYQGLVASGSKLIAMEIVNLEANSFATEPVANACRKSAFIPSMSDIDFV